MKRGNNFFDQNFKRLKIFDEENKILEIKKLGKSNEELEFSYNFVINDDDDITIGKKDYFNELPIMIISEILSLLDFEMLFTLKKVCSKWNRATSSNFFYSKLLQKKCQQRLELFSLELKNYVLVQNFLLNSEWKKKFQIKKFLTKNSLLEDQILGTKILLGERFYEGEFNKKGKQEGKGIIFDKNGIFLEGEFINGHIKKGKLFYPNGDFYDGYFNLDTFFEGDGELTILNYGFYKGQWKNGKKCGKGIFRFQNGNYYDGEWEDDAPNGKGIFLYKALAREYNGEWLRGVRTGFGTMKFYNGYYTGNWANDLPNGEGIIKYADGDKYKGNFLNNKFHGVGEFIWANGNKYTGYFKNGKQDGVGELSYKNGVTYKGAFINGNFEGICEIRDKLGQKFIGKISDGKKNGKGSFYNKHNKKYFEGFFKNNLKDGKGTYFANSKRLVVNYKNGSIVKIISKTKDFPLLINDLDFGPNFDIFN